MPWDGWVLDECGGLWLIGWLVVVTCTHPGEERTPQQHNQKRRREKNKKHFVNQHGHLSKKCHELVKKYQLLCGRRESLGKRE